jgi:ketosteroid isomerase-like protein
MRKILRRLSIAFIVVASCNAAVIAMPLQAAKKLSPPLGDTVLYPEAMEIIVSVINASAAFNIDAVANLYAPNAVVSDEEPPFAWNGPTAGVQWVNAVEKAAKQLKIGSLKVIIKQASVFQQTEESVYVIVPAEYRGRLPDNGLFEEKGAFTFVMRMVSGKWLIRSQAWMPKKGM